MNSAEQLCPSCGLCCNGVLFGDVELQPGDDAQRLAAEGLTVLRRKGKQIFNQPCACLVGGLCGIYKDRPVRCRTFDCRTLIRLQDGKVSLAQAQKTVASAREQAAEVQRLLRLLGNTEEHLPLSRRYAAVMAQPVDLAAGEAHSELLGELMLAVARLGDVLQRDFLV
jgi:hypothetical protein